ncbi:MAG: intradiol ring-cleavage dioxygenase [Myxococcales bacterium]|nr:intradiol ring-cleavage dioxygenase [Myxococcales bacterium]
MSAPKKTKTTKPFPHGNELDWNRTVSRRQALLTVGGLAVGALASACGKSSSSVGTNDAQAQGDSFSADGDTLLGGDLLSADLSNPSDLGGSEDLGVGTDLQSEGDAITSCTVYPQQTAGPFYLDLNLLRQNITEGKPGTPFTLAIQVVGSDGCAPLAGLAVDIWHCDADGRYSGFSGQLGNVDTTGQAWLRGTQVTDSEGRVSFETIYPGWYPGRTTHIHFRIHTSSTSEAVSQLYFPEAISAELYQKAPYDAHGPKDTSNAADGIFAANEPPLLELNTTSAGYSSTVVVTVQH